MRSHVVVVIPHGSRMIVKSGDKIKKGEKLSESWASENEVIPVASLLGVSPQKTPKYLVKKIGEKVSEGEIIAQKKDLFSSVAIKSPTDGQIAEINLKDGSLIVSAGIGTEGIVSPVSGVINDAVRGKIEIEFEGESFEGEEGGGQEAFGEMVYLPGKKINVLDEIPDVDGKIVFGMEITEAASAKLDAMGGVGLIFHKNTEEVYSPYIRVKEDVMDRLKSDVGKTVYLYPDSKKIVVPK